MDRTHANISVKTWDLWKLTSHSNKVILEWPWWFFTYRTEQVTLQRCQQHSWAQQASDSQNCKLFCLYFGKQTFSETLCNLSLCFYRAAYFIGLRYKSMTIIMNWIFISLNCGPTQEKFFDDFQLSRRCTTLKMILFFSCFCLPFLPPKAMLLFFTSETMQLMGWTSPFPNSLGESKVPVTPAGDCMKTQCLTQVVKMKSCLD